MNKRKVKSIKVFSLFAALVGFGATIITDWVNDRKMDQIIEEKVNKALAERKEEKES